MQTEFAGGSQTSSRQHLSVRNISPFQEPATPEGLVQVPPSPPPLQKHGQSLPDWKPPSVWKLTCVLPGQVTQKICGASSSNIQQMFGSGDLQRPRLLGFHRSWQRGRHGDSEWRRC